MADVRPLVRDELLPPKPPERRHLISIGDLTRDDVERLLTLAKTFAGTLDRDVKKLPTLRGRTVVNLFYESSTRTSSSFELAAKRLSADVMSIKSSGSAVEKGESLKDTLLTIGAYDPDDPNPQGVDRLIRSLEDNGLEPSANVYAELGGTWWFVMRDPTVAAHTLGKLLRHVGEEPGGQPPGQLPGLLGAQRLRGPRRQHR